MVCPRCIRSVENLLEQEGIVYQSVALGEVTVENPLPDEQRAALAKALEQEGFELLEDKKSQLIGKIKTLLIEQIHHQEDNLSVNYSTFLEGKLAQDYTALSRLFSSVEGYTIERFIVKQKIEKVKELLFYDELTLSEIAFQLGYSSTAHLSAQFKKETGMTASAFKKLRRPGHGSLDEL
ncbi:hypothetical protein GCM10023331_25010 [Algivirga pacifica]|uniref:HTH araC/xylS-type domain-containing protein n=2 Tax=Algivirga pacifica TaxID=1162670 RepID=A0ABP9DCT7_9BACT